MCNALSACRFHSRFLPSLPPPPAPPPLPLLHSLPHPHHFCFFLQTWYFWITLSLVSAGAVRCCFGTGVGEVVVVVVERTMEKLDLVRKVLKSFAFLCPWERPRVSARTGMSENQQTVTDSPALCVCGVSCCVCAASHRLCGYGCVVCVRGVEPVAYVRRVCRVCLWSVLFVCGGVCVWSVLCVQRGCVSV